MKTWKILPNKVTIVALVLSACYPQGPEYVDDFDIAVTRHDTSFSFESANTYAIPDDIVKLTGNLIEGDDPEFLDSDYTEVILTTIRDNMDKYGWTEVEKSEQPDVILLPCVTSSTYSFWYYDWWYWDWWYPYDWWGWYYPYPIYGKSYTSGTLFVQMTYPEGITPADNIPVVWTAVLNGLLEGSVTELDDRVERGINQAFLQSAYLDIE